MLENMLKLEMKFGNKRIKKDYFEKNARRKRQEIIMAEKKKQI
jgi:hypothetical protein